MYNLLKILKFTIILTINQNQSEMLMYKLNNLTSKLLLVLFALVPYIMESAFYWLPLDTDHASDTYTTLCVAIFGCWVLVWNNVKIFNTKYNLFTTYFIISVYGLFTVLTYILNTTLGFNNVNITSVWVYLFSTMLAMVALRFIPLGKK